MQNLKFAFFIHYGPQDAVLLDHDWDYYLRNSFAVVIMALG